MHLTRVYLPLNVYFLKRGRGTSHESSRQSLLSANTRTADPLLKKKRPSRTEVLHLSSAEGAGPKIEGEGALTGQPSLSVFVFTFCRVQSCDWFRWRDVLPLVPDVEISLPLALRHHLFHSKIHPETLRKPLQTDRQTDRHTHTHTQAVSCSRRLGSPSFPPRINKSQFGLCKSGFGRAQSHLNQSIRQIPLRVRRPLPKTGRGNRHSRKI